MSIENDQHSLPVVPSALTRGMVFLIVRMYHKRKRGLFPSILCKTKTIATGSAVLRSTPYCAVVICACIVCRYGCYLASPPGVVRRYTPEMQSLSKWLSTSGPSKIHPVFVIHVPQCPGSRASASKG